MANPRPPPQGQPQTAQHTDARPPARRAHAHRNHPAQTQRDDRPLGLQCVPHRRNRHSGLLRASGGARQVFLQECRIHPAPNLLQPRRDPDARGSACGITGLREGVNIFTVDLGKVETALRAIPQVQEVRIDRKLPDQIDISITARRPDRVGRRVRRKRRSLRVRKVAPGGRRRLSPAPASSLVRIFSSAR